MAVTDRGLASIMCELEAFNIFVDSCRKGPLNEYPSHYFVTHCHADHIQGLSPNWRRGTLYCTEPTQDYLLNKFSLDKQLFCVLDLYETKRIALHPSAFFEVTLIDACHCLGSAMFLFDGPFGKVLHTGDFRWDRQSIYTETKAELGELLEDIDAVVVDNTSSTAKQTFISRQDCMLLLAPVLDLYPKDTVFKVGVESIGKEELLEAIARRIKTKVLVKPDRYRLLSKHAVALDIDLFTTNREETRVHAVDRREVKEDSIIRWDSAPGFIVGIKCSPYIQAERGHNSSSKVLASKPHLRPFSVKSESDVARLNAKTKEGKLRHRLPKHIIIPYSLHSSFHEIANFIKYFRPGEVHPFVYFSGAAARSIAALNRKFCAPNLPRRRELKEVCDRLKQKRASKVTRKKVGKHIQGTFVSERVKEDRIPEMPLECSGDFEQSGYADPVQRSSASKAGLKRKRGSDGESTLVEMAITWLRRMDNNHIVAKIEELFGQRKSGEV